uniref:PHD-type domain-containing protein n=1 Tax=Hyaloperonospora arabidopsidis (strain Emoy2) TaxID=559515 RepID=M4BD70_HYAAE
MTTSGSSQVTRTRPDQPSSPASPRRPCHAPSDGLPLLPCHDAPVPVAFFPTPPPLAVAQFGAVASPNDVRAQLVARYRHNSPPLLEPVTELTLRIDTELELLRRRCFAQRNAQWSNATPDEFEFQPVSCNVWKLEAANDKLKLRKMKVDGVLDGSGKEFFYAPEKKHDQSDQTHVDHQYVRDRPWPPREFALKPVAKPSRGRGGKRKATPMGAVLDPVPRVAKTCRECGTQSTPLWRTQMRTIKGEKAGTMNGVAMVVNRLLAQNVAKGALQLMGGKTEEVEQQVEVDLCLACYLKLERADLFQQKRADKKRDERRKKEQAAAAVLQEKKRLKLQMQSLKKQQKEHKKQEELTVQPVVEEGEQVDEDVFEDDAALGAGSLQLMRNEVDAGTGSWKEKKKDRKHSRKDKKKKKKHRRKLDDLEDLESDGRTPIPSPAQMNGYVYADRDSDTHATPPVSSFETNQASLINWHMETVVAETEPEVPDDGAHDPKDEAVSAATARSSSRKRKSAQRTEPAAVVESSVSALKRRSTSSSRASRSKQTGARATTVASTAVTVSPAASVRKRSRTKREFVRERELRALGQYCPVCNDVYEDDDQNTFVCCDSCELWVHGACDPTLTQELIAAMSNTEDNGYLGDD